MPITGPQACAARVLVEWPRDHVARLSGVESETLTAFERGKIDPGDDARNAIKAALESGGAVFIPEDGRDGLGVRLKFTSKDARQINRLESEGGPVGDDDV